MRVASGIVWILLMSVAANASALPPIVIFNYAPPAPSFEMISLSPANHQEFTRTPPPAVSISFTQAIAPEKSDLKVFDAYNNQIGKPRESPKDNAMKVILPPKLLAGTYRIQWNATCACKGQAAINGTSYFTMY